MIYDTEANLPVEHDLTIFPVESRANFPDGFDNHCSIHVSGIRLGSLLTGAMIEGEDEDLILVEVAKKHGGRDSTLELPT